MSTQRPPTNENMSADHEPSRRAGSFGMVGLFVVMLVTSVAAAAGFYVVKGLQSGRQAQLVGLLFTLAAPPLLLVIVSVLYHLARYFSQSRN